MSSAAEREKVTSWAVQVRVAASWQGGVHARKLNALADEMDEFAGDDTAVVLSPEQRAQGVTEEQVIDQMVEDVVDPQK